MGLFFNCDKCSKRFIAQYDECKFQSCNRLTDETVDAPAESWAEFPLWLWEVHNDVSRSKAEREADFHEKYNRKAVAKKWERLIGAVYPHLDQCLSCWTADGTWDVDAVYNHLEKEYWTFGVEVNSKMENLLDHKDVDSVSHGLGAYLGLGIVVLLTYFLKKYKIRASGRHKKDDENLFPRASGDGRIKRDGGMVGPVFCGGLFDGHVRDFLRWTILTLRHDAVSTVPLVSTFDAHDLSSRGSKAPLRTPLPCQPMTAISGVMESPRAALSIRRLFNLIGWLLH
eukprot:scaffold5949_cov120-Skeletonema_dohrnii-CCMP3373.AAC.4